MARWLVLPSLSGQKVEAGRRAPWCGLILAVVSLCTACEAATGPPTHVEDPFGNLVFAGTTPIEVASPGEGCFVGVEPNFVWKATGKRLVHAAVFDSAVDVVDGRISNTNANVWAWHTGLGTGIEGRIQFTDGVSVVHGVLQLGTDPAPLEQGKAYIWAVWAWSDSTGTHVTESSPAVYFVVDTTRVGCPPGGS